jgi:CheY-like chemotaxis protein
LQREAAILTLSDIQPLDPRALPALKARLEDAKETAVVKAMATRLIKKISGLTSEATKPSSEYYYDLANRYFLDRAGVSEEAEEADGIIWHLNEAGELIPVQYPLWAWSEQMAEDVLLQGLAINPDYTAFFPLWACIHASQFAHVKDLVDILNENPSQNSFSAEEKKEVENWDKKLVNARRLVAAVGKEHVNAALNKVHADMKKYASHERLPQLGVFLASELAAIDPRGELLTTPADVLVALKAGQDPVTVITPNTPVTVKSENGPVSITLKPESVEVVALPNNEKNGKSKKGDVAPVADNATPLSVATAAVKLSTSALVCGLDSADESIQYACAVSLAKIDRFPCKWIGSEKVAKILGRGVSEDKSLQVLLVEENTNKANEMRQRLVDLGYGVSLASSAREAIMVARSYPPKDAAVISDVLRRDLSTIDLLEEMRADPRTRYLPMSILHVRADQAIVKARFGSEILLVEREMSGADLKAAIEAVAAKRAAESVPKRKAHEVSVACSNALASIDPRDTFLNLNDAVQNAIGALSNRPDDVRNPSTIFLGKVEGGTFKAQAADALKKVILDGANAVELRRNALRAIGRIQKEGLEELYLKNQADADQEIKDIAAESFGQLSRANKEINGLIRSQRIDKDIKEK